MNIETWLAFVATSAVLVVMPGPTTLLVVSYALGQGWRTALPMAVGVALGDITAMSVSMLGLGAVLAASATLFTMLKWIGAAYLIWLGIKLWRAGGTLEPRPHTEATTSLTMLLHAWIVTVLNPKGITFYVAFLPLFIDAKAPLLPQMLVLGPTFLCLAFATVLGYALLASRARAMISNPRTVTLVHRTGATFLVGGGLATLAIKAQG